MKHRTNFVVTRVQNYRWRTIKFLWWHVKIDKCKCVQNFSWHMSELTFGVLYKLSCDRSRKWLVTHCTSSLNIHVGIDTCSALQQLLHTVWKLPFPRVHVETRQTVLNRCETGVQYDAYHAVKTLVSHVKKLARMSLDKLFMTLVQSDTVSSFQCF